ncbi:hypothetical protein BH24ACI3_BH24ACI3_01480 [soil metagenome]
MKNLVRGGVILSVFSLFVVFIYAQTQTEKPAKNAKGSQTQLNIKEANIEAADNKKVVNKDADKAENKPADTQKEDDKKLVTKTTSSKAIGVSKGKFVATAYCLRGRTANGSLVRKGIIAADPRVLRLGSQVNVGGGAYSGNYTVTDTGGKIKGNRIDIWMASCAEARRFGRRTVTINLLK